MPSIDSIKGYLRGRCTVLTGVWNHPLNRGSKIKAIRDYVLWNAVRFTMDVRHLAKMPGGIEIILGRKENYGSAVYTHGVPDFAEMLFLAHLLRKGDLFLDVGANVGMYSLWVGTITGAKVEAFEPIPETFRTLVKNIRLNNLEGLVTTHNVAAGSTPGEVLMSAGQSGLAHVLEQGSANSISVPVCRLDDVASGKSPYAIKMDVEGFELHALQGAGKILANPHLRAILIELQDWTLKKYGTSEQEVREVLIKAGFQPYSYDPVRRELLPHAEKAGLNEIFMRPDEDLQERLASAPKIPLPGYSSGI